MAGVNPYIKQADIEMPKEPFKVTFEIEETGEVDVVEVDPSKIPYDRTGLPGSLLDIAFGAGIEIEHTCGGVCACSTCHVMVREGMDSCNEGTDDEFDRVEEAPGNGIQSRLACQCVPNGTQDLVVKIPKWNRNAVKEEPHEH